MLRPLGYKVLVKDIIEEEQTVGGIIIPDNAKELDGSAEVIKLGSGFTNRAGVVEKGYPFKVGDKVIIPMNRECGTVVHHGEERYKIFDVEDILAIITE
tara:strand:+ start:3391 stop:3687 length:297 start_codon:yes stop_codon:yes gene_type:complete